MTDAETPSLINACLGEGLTYLDVIPVQWERLDGPPPEATFAVLNEENERLLRYMSSLDEYMHEGKDAEPLAHDVARLEFKVNMLMEMVSQVLAQRLELPAPSAVEMKSNGISCVMPEAPEQGRYFQLAVYLNRQYLKPLVVCGRVAGVEKATDGVWKVVCTFEGLSDIVRDHLERMIFRQHRRMVALLHQTEK
ncbi:MAG: hypothetical protein GC138_01895 [Gammaproteobacteria bacterium]|nr:hypothetical protein [Gammaproteobacteria bacterium]